MKLTTSTKTMSNIPINLEVKGPAGTQNENDEERGQPTRGKEGTQNLPEVKAPEPPTDNSSNG